MPYRVDLPDVGEAALDRLVELGALDIERLQTRGIAALMPDSVAPAQLVDTLGIDDISISPAAGRDDDSVWILSPQPVRVGQFRLVPSHIDTDPGALRLIDGTAFGTGLHPTTALCLEILGDVASDAVPDSVLDVGTGSGVLALAALLVGVRRALGIDVDDEALSAAAENARINGLQDRLQLARGGPETVDGTWPLILANVLAAPLVEMAPALVRRVGHHGKVVLSGIPVGVDDEVERAYRRSGMRRLEVRSRAGWVALVLQASW